MYIYLKVIKKYDSQPAHIIQTIFKALSVPEEREILSTIRYRDAQQNVCDLWKVSP